MNIDRRGTLMIRTRVKRYWIAIDLPQIVVPVAMLVPDASSEVCAGHRDVVCQGPSSRLVPVAGNPGNCAAVGHARTDCSG